MEMKKLLESIQQIEECPSDMAEGPVGATSSLPAPEAQGNPVTVNVSMNASGKEHVADLMRMMQQAGLDDAKPVGPDMMPMRQDMERLRAIVDEPGDEDPREDLSIEDYENEPDEEYHDHELMTKDLSGGLNREKKMHKPAAGGDNPMAVEDDDDTAYSIRGKSPEAQQELARRANEDDSDMVETIRSSLMAALQEKKAKPDFLDVDKDGDKKEPMKKAIKDKGGKAKKGEVPPQFKKK